MSEVFRISVGSGPVPREYERLDGKLYQSVEAASEAVREAYRAVRAQLPEEAGATIGPRHAREFVERTAHFPAVWVIRERVE